MGKLNRVKERFVFLSPSVQSGWEDESNISDFEVSKKCLGKGAFGEVFKVTHKKTKLIYAIKILDKVDLKQYDMVNQVSLEIKIMYSLTNPYILRLYNHFEDDKKIYLVLEFATGGQLYKKMFSQPTHRFNETTTASYIRQLIAALKKCHSMNIIHRDIKPENILLDDKNRIKLADFGWSNYLSPNSKRSTFCGTLDYLPPEMLEKNRDYGEGVDIWCVGVLSYELMVGSAPFSPLDQSKKQEDLEYETKVNIKNTKFSFPLNFPALAISFISQILVKDPKKRLTLNEMIDHPWLVSHFPDGFDTNDDDDDEEFKDLKSKEIVTISNPEATFITSNLANGFSNDEIINKEFNEKYKKKANFEKEIKAKSELDFDFGAQEFSPNSKKYQPDAFKLDQTNKIYKEMDAEKGLGYNNENEINHLRRQLAAKNEAYENLHKDFLINYEALKQREMDIMKLKVETEMKISLQIDLEKKKSKLSKQNLTIDKLTQELFDTKIRENSYITEIDNLRYGNSKNFTPDVSDRLKKYQNKVSTADNNLLQAEILLNNFRDLTNGNPEIDLLRNKLANEINFARKKLAD